MGVKDKKFWYYWNSLKSLIFRGLHEKNNIFGGLPKKEGLDCADLRRDLEVLGEVDTPVHTMAIEMSKVLEISKYFN